MSLRSPLRHDQELCLSGNSSRPIAQVGAVQCPIWHYTAVAAVYKGSPKRPKCIQTIQKLLPPDPICPRVHEDQVEGEDGVPGK